MHAKPQLVPGSQTSELASILQQTNALVDSEHLFSQFDQGDLLMPRLAWNMGKSGLKNPATGRRIANDEFFDLRNEVSLGSELTGTILFIGKGFDYRRFDGEKSVIHCRSNNRTVGYPRTEKVTPTRDDGGADCATCAFRKPAQKQTEDGRTLLVPECSETYEVLFLADSTMEVYLVTLRGKSYRQLRPLIQKFYGVRVQGRLVNVPWYVRRVTAKLVLAAKNDYAICCWETGETNTAESILWAKGWLEERQPSLERQNNSEPVQPEIP